jgi:hypothetical protein
MSKHRRRPASRPTSRPDKTTPSVQGPGLRFLAVLLICVSALKGQQAASAAQNPPPSSAASASGPPSIAPRELLKQLDGVSFDTTQIYALRHAEITRDRLKFYFNRGFIGFLAPVAGEITGAAFTGDGEVLLMPPNAADRQSLAQFTQAPILEERFTSVYLRFTDQTARELRARAERPDSESPEQPTGFIDAWNPVAQALASGSSLRILQDMLGRRDRPYFYARISGVNLGVFEALDDERAYEAVSIGAASRVGEKVYAGTWCSFPSRFSEGHSSDRLIRVRSYKIDTRIDIDNSLEGHARLEIESGRDGERVIFFELSRSLKVSEVKDGQGRSLVFFQNPSLEESETAVRGNDLVAVVLPAPRPVGERYVLEFTYRGNVIADVGNGVLFVGAHGSWYPNRGLIPHSDYDLTFHYPDRVSLVATGRLLSETSSQGWKDSHWVSDGAFPVAGFNLGAYDKDVRRVGGTALEVYATQGAEASLEKRHAAAQPLDRVVVQGLGQGKVPVAVAPKSVEPLTPAALVDRVAQSAAETVRFFESLFGPFPYPRLAISQIPGDFGQGWPELVYLPTLYFLPRATRSELGFNTKSAELQNRLFLAHEIAHQWWGNEVGWKTYHDEWLSEGFATYAAALDLTREKDGERDLRDLLRSYRADLLAKNKDGKTVESGGPIWLGERLSTSLNPDGYNDVVYKKACWAIHMLRMLIRDSSSGGAQSRRGPSEPQALPDGTSSDPAAEGSAPTSEVNERFFKMLRAFITAYRDQNPSTEDFASFAAKYMSPAMNLDRNGRLDWFFDDWVRGTGIPTYKLQATVRRLTANKFVVEGEIEQSDVPPGFEMLVPVVVSSGKSKTLLGEVHVTDSGGHFRFTTPSKPGRVAIDDEQILAVVK